MRAIGIGKESEPQIWEPSESPVPAEIPAPDPDPVETPTPIEVPA